MRKPIVSVIGNAHIPQDSPQCILAYEIGKKLMDAGYRLSTGGLDGVMEAVSRGASESENHEPGSIIGLIPSFNTESCNPYIDTPIATGLDIGRNVVVANADAVVAVGGGAGTLSEMANAWALNRLIIACRITGWSAKLADTRIDEKIRYETIPEDRVYGADTADDVIQLLNTYIGKYTKRHDRLPKYR